MEGGGNPETPAVVAARVMGGCGWANLALWLDGPVLPNIDT